MVDRSVGRSVGRGSVGWFGVGRGAGGVVGPVGRWGVGRSIGQSVGRVGRSIANPILKFILEQISNAATNQKL